MNLPIIEDEYYHIKDFREISFTKARYEYCKFEECDFSGVDLSSVHFLECKFIKCNLSNANIRDTSFNSTIFIESKLLGLLFNQCNSFLFRIEFKDCDLSYTSFYKVRLKGSQFVSCKLHDVDFTETDCFGLDFDQCDLLQAKFEYTNLKNTDFRTATQYQIDPTINKFQKTKFSKDGILGLLIKYDILVE